MPDEALIESLEPLRLAYKHSWQAINERMWQLELLHRMLLHAEVETVAAGTTKIQVTATDQGGPGWVYVGDDQRIHDSDEITMLLYEYGEFHSSEDHPDHLIDLTWRSHEDDQTHGRERVVAVG
jgi:hypothetical protein